MTENKIRILIVDDNHENIQVLGAALAPCKYQISVATSGENALKSIASHQPDLILLDVMMPGIDGFEVCRQLKANPVTCNIPVIFVSALWNTDEKLQGFKLGAVDYITKPYEHEELLARVHTHLELHQLRDHLQDMVEERSNELLKSESKLKASLIDSITALAAIAEMRDPYTAGHQRRVAKLAVAIAEALQLPKAQQECIHLASVVHDVGKIVIPSGILCKSGRLSTLEMALIKEHPQNGYDVLKNIDFPWPIAQIVWQHHERLDGSGYPKGLKGEQILFESRIVTVADVVESMMSHRPYRPGLGIDAALSEINDHKNTFFDPVAVDACSRLFREKQFDFMGS